MQPPNPPATNRLHLSERQLWCPRVEMDQAANAPARWPEHAEFALLDQRDAVLGEVSLVSTHQIFFIAFVGELTQQRVFIDPVGDLLSFYEFTIGTQGELLQRIWRMSRSGYRVDSRSNSSNTPVRVQVELPLMVTLTIPFTEIPPAAGAPGEVWRVEFDAVSTSQQQPALPSPAPLRPALAYTLEFDGK